MGLRDAVRGRENPVIIGEFGDDSEDFDRRVLGFAAEHDLPRIAWSLHPGARPSLIKGWEFTPNGFGQRVKDALHKAPAGR